MRHPSHRAQGLRTARSALQAAVACLAVGWVAAALADEPVVIDGPAHPGAVFRIGGRDARVVATGFLNPCGLAADEQGTLFVADECDAGTIFKVTPEGQKSPVAANRPMPRHVAIDSERAVWHTHRPSSSPIEWLIGVSRLSPDGRVQAVTYRFGVLESPHGIALNRFGSVYVADHAKNAIYIISITAQGEVQVRALPFAFVKPTALAFSPRGDLFIACSGTGTVARITIEAVASVFARGLESPSALAFDKDGRLFVASETNGTIRQLSPDGKTSTLFARGLVRPRGLAFDTQGNLFVTNGRPTQAKPR